MQVNSMPRVYTRGIVLKVSTTVIGWAEERIHYRGKGKQKWIV